MKDDRSVCIVGKSDSLLGKGLGDVIDAHDIVFRVNMPPINGYEKDVGIKTNVCFINFSLILNHKIDETQAELEQYVEGWKTCEGKSLMMRHYGNFWSEITDLENHKTTPSEKIKNVNRLLSTADVFFQPTIENEIDMSAFNLISFNKQAIHGLTTGTSCIISCIKKYKNVSIVGMGNSDTNSYCSYYFNSDYRHNWASVGIDRDFEVFLLDRFVKDGFIDRLD